MEHDHFTSELLEEIFSHFLISDKIMNTHRNRENWLNSKFSIKPSPQAFNVNDGIRDIVARASRVSISGVQVRFDNKISSVKQFSASV